MAVPRASLAREQSLAAKRIPAMLVIKFNKLSNFRTFKF